MDENDGQINGYRSERQSPEPNSPKPGRKTNSRERANFLSKLWFLWMLPLFRKGLSKDLTVTDLCQPVKDDLSEELANKLEKKWFEEIIKARSAGKKPSLLKALVRTFISYYILDGFLLFIQGVICRPFQPIFLAWLVDYFTPNSTTTSEMAYLYATGMILLSILNIFTYHHSSLRTQQLGMRLRVACCSLIYRKVLRLDSKSLGRTTAGQLVNIMSNDVIRFDSVLLFLHYFWIMPFQVILVCYLIYTQVSIAALIGVASITLQTLPVQGYMSKLSSSLRKKIAVRTDERVRLMNEIISGIQVIKMYAWEKPFERIVSVSRAYEISAITKASYLRGIYMSFMVFTERATLYVTLLAFSLLGHQVTSSIVFSLAQFYNILQASMSIMFPNIMSSSAECWVTIKRLQAFLVMEERSDLEIVSLPITDVSEHIIKSKHNKSDKDISLHGKQIFKSLNEPGLTNLGFDSREDLTMSDGNVYGVEIKNVTASWTDQQISLNNVTIEVLKGKLCAIIGSVGSGKSTVLQLLLKELTQRTGSVRINGNFSYASQEPWLFVATVKNNILFGQPYNHKRYREVVRVCALEKDFQQFPRGDQTLVGERGVSLSGGQRARINLARAIYREADVYLLDDPLSAVDAHVGRHLFNECISHYLKEKTVVLVTHQLHYLHGADMIVIMKNGSVENTGSYDQLVSSGANFSSLLSSLQETKTVDVDDKTHTRTKLKRAVSQVSTASTTKSENDDENAEELEEEEQLKGKMSTSVYFSYWRAGGSIFFVFFMVFVMILGQISASISDYWVTYWTNQQNYKDELEDAKTNDTLSDSVRSTTDNFDLYEKIGPFNTMEYLYIYTIIIVLCIVMTISRSLLFFKVCMNASKGLHDQMFHKISRGVMRFFDTNPSGRILNRFSKDIGAVDELLPRATIEAVQIFLVMCSILVLVSITNVWMMIPVIFVLVLFYNIFIMYLNTAQDIKRLEGITRSPVFSHVTSSLNGITTIRACNASQRLALEFDIHQNLHTSAWYQYIACCTTLGFWLDLICVIFLAIVSYTFIITKTDDSLSGNVGLAISQSLILSGMLQFGVRQSGEIVSQMTSVERVLQYTEIEEEKCLDEGQIDTPKTWPSTGTVVFDHMFLKYSDDNPPVLKDLNIIINNGWKVGIVGRTGAGKSSLITALFRLAKLEGNIIVDEIETGKLSLQDLRSRISIIPQEPVLFSASVRYNLDPFNKFDDASLWHSLEAVELKDAVPSLDFHVSERGSNFSLGQRQLICLARAILRNNKILVLDEATANVDPQTDAFIQKTIRDKFKHCTVLTIAHRLNTIMDSDRVLVMDTGKMVEFDHPYILLNNTDGHLYKMVQETGYEMTSSLHKISKQAYILSGGVPLNTGLEEELAEQVELLDEKNEI
ncbi:ATP-binding cassette sub-family C member 4-like [Arctopsyche grandis]|uniref:ATP-binding cassette sub-family C member 4-like n=1 Tax=Arctopsyche grandis TaxID=121162 RepID=UPI00406D8D3F